MNNAPTRAPNWRRQQGFTLVEIMVVIVILGLLATLVTQNVIGMSDDAKIQKAQTDTKTISEAARLFRIKNGKVPTMEDLTTPDERGHAYIEDMSKDPWGNDYEIREDDIPGKFYVISGGPNGQPGDEDDVSSKSEPSK